MAEFNNDVVRATLKKVVKILSDHNIKYLFLGSVVIAGINGKLHRKLGDLDLIVDENGKEILYRELTKFGYKRPGGMFAFVRQYLSLESLRAPDLLEIGFFHGVWQPDGSFVMGNKKFNVTIDAHALTETEYELYGVKFFGIPQEAAATGIATSKTNPKRKKEVLLLAEKGIQPLPNTYIHTRIYGIQADWIYHICMTILNILGEVRVRTGLAFDPWR